jgi:hypothetical protein
LVRIEKSTLKAIREDREEFSRFVKGYVLSVTFEHALLRPRFSEARLRDAHHYWQADMKRVEGYSLPSGSDGADHFKHAGHLTYWLRRSVPIVELNELSLSEAESAGRSLTEEPDQALRDLLYDYATEYLAFDLGFAFCMFYERNRVSPSRSLSLQLDEDFIKNVCCFLKEKNVSPHALNLMFRSLFFQR